MSPVQSHVVEDRAHRKDGATGKASIADALQKDPGQIGHNLHELNEQVQSIEQKKQENQCRLQEIQSEIVSIICMNQEQKEKLQNLRESALPSMQPIDPMRGRDASGHCHQFQHPPDLAAPLPGAHSSHQVCTLPCTSSNPHKLPASLCHATEQSARSPKQWQHQASLRPSEMQQIPVCQASSPLQMEHIKKSLYKEQKQLISVPQQPYQNREYQF